MDRRRRRRNVPGLHVQLRVDKMGDLSSIGVWRSIHQRFTPLTASHLQRRFMPFVNPFSDDVIEACFICVAANPSASSATFTRCSPHMPSGGNAWPRPSISIRDAPRKLVPMRRKESTTADLRPSTCSRITCVGVSDRF